MHSEAQVWDLGFGDAPTSEDGTNFVISVTGSLTWSGFLLDLSSGILGPDQTYHPQSYIWPLKYLGVSPHSFLSSKPTHMVFVSLKIKACKS